MRQLALRVVPLALAALAACSPPAATSSAPDVTPVDQIVSSHAQATSGGHVLNYTTRAGLLPIYDNDTGALMARMFFVAYVADQPKGAAPRPLTFMWNGGPGANAAESHLVGFGPKIFHAPSTFPEWRAPVTEVEDNPSTLLQVSDLVFVDPIGTGYSRATSIANRDVLYTTHGDAEAVAEFIRVYRTRYNGFASPLFISGESYGTTRAREVAWSLARRHTPVAGVILISGEYEVGAGTPPWLDAALQTTTYAAAAQFHHRLAADLQALPRDELLRRVEAWARQSYAPALQNPAALSAPQRTQVLADLERYSGLGAASIDPATLRPMGPFQDLLLADRHLELGRYDDRRAGAARPAHSAWSVTQDPSIAPLLDVMQGTSPALISYLRNTIGYRSDLLYRGPFGGSFHPTPLMIAPPGAPPELTDDWMTMMWDRGHQDAPAMGPPPSGPPNPPLLKAMQADPEMHVFLAHGLYDSGSCAADAETVARTPAELRGRVRFHCYDAGHVIYSDAATRAAYLRDFTAFVRDASQRGH